MTDTRFQPGSAALRQALDAIAPAIENLARHQEQCDMDGVMVKVSRQALDEVLNAVNNIAIDLSGGEAVATREPNSDDDVVACANAGKQMIAAGPALTGTAGDTTQGDRPAATVKVRSSEAVGPPDRDKLWHLIAKHIACEEDCQKQPTGCGCARDATDAVLAALPSEAGINWKFCNPNTGEIAEWFEPASPLPSETAAVAAPKPAAWILPGDDIASESGWLDARIDEWGEFTRPLYAAPSTLPSEAIGREDDRGAQALRVVRQMVEAYDSGNLQMSSPEIGEPENDIPYHPWHAELLHYARLALEPSTVSRPTSGGAA